MRLENKSTVPAPVDTVWRALLDPVRVAPVFPGSHRDVPPTSGAP